MAVDENLNKWRENGKHLPKFMRDFHDQKALFRTMHYLTESSDYVSLPEGMSYVIDLFLWFMARHGYTLQKSHARQNFEDLKVNIETCEETRTNIMKNLILGEFSGGKK